VLLSASQEVVEVVASRKAELLKVRPLWSSARAIVVARVVASVGGTVVSVVGGTVVGIVVSAVAVVVTVGFAVAVAAAAVVDEAVDVQCVSARAVEQPVGVAAAVLLVLAIAASIVAAALRMPFEADFDAAECLRLQAELPLASAVQQLEPKPM